MIRTIFFDLDNTLIDRSAAFCRYSNNFMTCHRHAFEGYRHDTVLRRMIEHDDYGYCKRTEFCTWVADSFPELKLTADQIWEDFSTSIASFIRPSLPVNKMLTELQERFPLYIISNGSGKIQRKKMEHAGIEPFFSGVFISGEIGISKPDSGIFELAIAHSGCSPEETLYIGDDPWRDVYGARTAGMSTCWVSSGRTIPDGCPQPDFCIVQIDELKGLRL